MRAGSTLKYLFHDYTGPRCDVRLAGSVIPVAVNPVRPSLSLQRHAGHCDDIPDTIGVRGDKTSPRPPLCHVRAPVDGTLESARYGGRTTNHYAAALEAAPVRAQDAPRRHDWNEIRQDGRQLHGTTRHASTRRRIVRHACKSPSPWSIKGRAIPQPHGGNTGRQTTITHALSVFSTILALASINTSGTWRPGLLSLHACSPLYEHRGAKQYSALSTPLLDVRPRAEPG
jgi:hypothetical protein